MKVKSLMISSPITITETASVQEAIALMKSHSIRHLPVVEGNNTLKGLVTLADLKLGLIPSLIGDVSLTDLMIRNPICVTPDDDIETAARLIYNHKISGIPVIKSTKLVGIITETDILRAFIDMMGLLTSSSRIDVAIGEKPNALKKVLQIIQEQGGDIINIGMTAEKSSQRIYYFRLALCKTDKIKSALEQEGFNVVDATD